MYKLKYAKTKKFKWKKKRDIGDVICDADNPNTFSGRFDGLKINQTYGIKGKCDKIERLGENAKLIKSVRLTTAFKVKLCAQLTQRNVSTWRTHTQIYWGRARESQSQPKTVSRLLRCDNKIKKQNTWKELCANFMVCIKLNVKHFGFH